MPLYTGVGGVVKEMKELHLGVGGAVKTAKNGYVGINGVVKPFFDSAISAIKVIPHQFQVGLVRNNDILGYYCDDDSLSGGLVTGTSYTSSNQSYAFSKRTDGGVDIVLKTTANRCALFAARLNIIQSDNVETSISKYVWANKLTLSSKIGVSIDNDTSTSTCYNCYARAYNDVYDNNIFNGAFTALEISRTFTHDDMGSSEYCNWLNALFGSNSGKQMTITIYPITLNGVPYDIVF